MALMGTGVAKGENRALEAAQRAISSPLLEETSIQGARGVLINISGGLDLTLHEVAEAARIISDAVDPDANIISGMVIEPGLEEAMKVTVIATGFDRLAAERPRGTVASLTGLAGLNGMPSPAGQAGSLGAAGGPRAMPVPGPAPAPLHDEQDGSPADIPFYRKAIAHARPDDPNGFGPNWSNVDDYDIPTVLRKQMD
jgi:cell division protein FtsZ